MKKLLLHVGFHKTATSSIQKTLAKNNALLASLGYIYPSFDYKSKKVINHSIPIYSIFCESPASYHINIRNGDLVRVEELNKDYMLQFTSILETNKNVIISGEDISTLSLQALIELKNLISSYGFELEVYCSVRKAYSFTCSELQERIKNGTGTLEK
ncbi:hypothetical protein [Pseudoalteromonas sp. BSi20652]|uniref:hypothetical protein n=1 Tax=Pseudoalteromonas sp. BSi20652 TaxID=388384 RepID=UPI000518DE3B|nr:hypothetical protein [Pseudoalteromonas sp. BSi20652]